VGLAYRPVRHDRLSLLGKYTFLEDLSSAGQAGAGTDQRSHVLSGEIVWRISRRWELGAKLAERTGELRSDRGSGDWFESTAEFAALRGSFHVVRMWDLLTEYRWLSTSDLGETRQGVLAGLDRHLGEHFKVGIGYNFTDFSEDLTDLSYESQGWFVNFVTKY
jgi:hypothetical protein